MMFAPFDASRINLRTDRISITDADRQAEAAREILRRLARQPGVVLADEVGMGKTFVAMAVAASIILDRPAGGPVVVMVPPSLKSKWPKDWEVFREKCLDDKDRRRIRQAQASSGIEFLKLLDDPTDRKSHIIFLTHGALHTGLNDEFVRLAVIRRAFKGRSSLAAQRRNFPRFAGRLLRMETSYERLAPGLLGELFERPSDSWMRVIRRSHPELKEKIKDDPVPFHLQQALEEIDGATFEPLVEELRRLPLKESANIKERLTDVRRALARAMSDIWRLALRKAKFHPPLLILDEAHHIKNPATRLASLFIDPQAAEDSEYFEQAGALGGKFDRMLFLTATPFQLGHAELIRVLERFEGISWTGPRRPTLSREEFKSEIAQLHDTLDDAQAAALRLDRAWGRLRTDALTDENGAPITSDQWWSLAARSQDGLLAQIIEQVESTSLAMRKAEAMLRPWVLRHLKTRHLPDSPVERRRVLSGGAILNEQSLEVGLEITEGALFPFLLAGRAQAMLAASRRGRALFAEGLASSFEAYRETREGKAEIDEDFDLDESAETGEIDWYLDHLDQAIPRESHDNLHPKVRATAECAVRLWNEGEKTLIFCHYRATGRALRRHISACLHREIIERGHRQLPHLRRDEVAEELERIGDRFFDTDGLLREKVDEAIEEIVRRFEVFRSEQRQRIVEVIRRFLRTPSFLVRYFDLSRADHAGAFAEAIDRDVGGIALRKRIERFCRFLAERCIDSERDEYLEALRRIQTGSHVGHEVQESFDVSEGIEARTASPLPNVRLANGKVKYETRLRLLLAFNTPLFPEILIASSVLAEGVDLHLNCRHVIHHDLCWNPSTLEQRTGRIDRLGSKAEQVSASIHVYLPFVAATQDEKMYRVVRDRERWFQIVMGEKYEVDESATDRRADRVPLPSKVQSDLTMKLDI